MKNTHFMTRVLTISVLLLISIPLAAAMYLPTMPAGTGNFGTAIQASASFNDGYHWDDLSTPGIDEREIPSHYQMPSSMASYTAGDALDWHWVWVGNLGDHVIWEFTNPILCVRVYPSQDHGPYIGSEFDEYTVYASNDLVNWNLATEKALYYDDITNVRTHDGVKDYYLGGTTYKYIKIISAIDADFELDAVEEIDYDPECIPEFSTIVIPIASILGLLFFFNRRKQRKE